MINYQKEFYQKMDLFRQLFLYREYLQKFKLMIFSPLLEMIIFSLENAIQKLKTVGQSFWKNSGLEIMLIMNEQSQVGNTRLFQLLLDYQQKII